MGYRFLGPGELFMAGDEFLDDDGRTWLPLPWFFRKCRWSPLFKPVRRPSNQQNPADPPIQPGRPTMAALRDA